MKNYIYADFTKSCGNFGNKIIEVATEKLISGKGIEVGRFDSFKKNTYSELSSINHDLVLIPGCTMITYGQNPGLNEINHIEHPIVCLAGSIWNNDYEDRNIYLRKRLIYKRIAKQPRLDIVKKLSGPVGCRDRYTYQTLLSNGIDSVYVGCPTLFLKKDDFSGNTTVTTEYGVFSFGRENLQYQVKIAKKLMKDIPIIGISHELNENQRIRAAGWMGPLITSANNITQYLSYFANASLVVTGRLHGLLPSIAFERPVIYFGTRDSRTSILDDIGTPIYSLQEISTNRAAKSWNQYVIDNFRIEMESLAKTILC